MSEIWKDVVGYEGIYEVSNNGRVRSKEGKTTHTVLHGKRKWKQRILKNKTPNGRDVRVSLWKDGRHKDFLVHRLVAFAFIPLIKGKNCINHIDGNPKNNYVENLEWCNHKENNNHAYEVGLMTTCKEIQLFNEETEEIKHFRSMAKASQYLGYSNSYLSGALKRGKVKFKKYRVIN